MVGMMNLDTFHNLRNTVEFSYSFILTDFGIQFFDESGSDSVPDGFAVDRSLKVHNCRSLISFDEVEILNGVGG